LERCLDLQALTQITPSGSESQVKAHAVEADVAGVREEGVTLDACLLRCGVEVFGGVREPLAECEALVHVGQHPLLVVGELLPPGLDGEVGLGRGDLWFGRVAVHGHQVASISRKEVVLLWPLRATSDFHHVRRLGKMVPGLRASTFTG